MLIFATDGMLSSIKLTLEYNRAKNLNKFIDNYSQHLYTIVVDFDYHCQLKLLFLWNLMLN